jgi:tRNA threonylcarbamoyladenosine biosynthesis protein TsaB
MTILVIETATPACSIALIDGDTVVDERHELLGRGHAERLMPMIAELMGETKPSSILVDCGPGSFTGLRVGLAAAQGLAIGWRVPLHGYSATALIACHRPNNQDVTIAMTGGHGRLFVQSYGGDPLDALDTLRSLAPDEAAAGAPAALVLGSGAEALVTARGWGEWQAALPRAADAWRLPAALRSLEPRPLYGREADAKPMQ